MKRVLLNMAGYEKTIPVVKVAKRVHQTEYKHSQMGWNDCRRKPRKALRAIRGGRSADRRGGLAWKL